MNLLRVVRAIGFTLTLVILGVSGAYVVIDLARWEWNRAVISALVFLSGLVVLVAMLLLRQLHRLELRMAALERQRRDESDTLGVLRTTNATAARGRFRWLEPSKDRVGVFIPVLLGAGVVLSFVAYLIERIAGAFAATTLDRRTVRDLAVDLPLGSGLIDRAMRDQPPPRSRRGVRVAALVVTVVLAVGLVQTLRVLTQTRPEEVTSDGLTSIVVDIAQRREHREPRVVADDLWSSCRSRLGGSVELLAVTELLAGRVQLDLDRALGHTGRARIIGCLEDYTLDLVRAAVVGIDVTRDVSVGAHQG